MVQIASFSSSVCAFVARRAFQVGSRLSRRSPACLQPQVYQADPPESVSNLPFGSFLCAKEPFWGRCTAHRRTYFSGVWEVTTGIPTHGQGAGWKKKSTQAQTTQTVRERPGARAGWSCACPRAPGPAAAAQPDASPLLLEIKTRSLGVFVLHPGKMSRKTKARMGERVKSKCCQ